MARQKAAMENIVAIWNSMALDAIRGGNTPPPIAARSLAVLNTAIYDAWAAYDSRAKPVHSAVSRRAARDRTAEGRRTAIHMAAFRAMLDQFPERTELFATRLCRFGIDPCDEDAGDGSPVAVGNAAARAVTGFRRRDGANQLGDENGSSGGAYSDYTGYNPVNAPITGILPSAWWRTPDPSRWQPVSSVTGVAGQFAAPHWGRVHPFAIAVEDFGPRPPHALGEQAAELMQLQARLTPQEKVGAEYWSEGLPSRWMRFSEFVAKRDDLDLDGAVKLFFAVSNALMDTGIAVWEAKRRYDSARPITVIRHLYQGRRMTGWAGPSKGTVEIDGAAWRPFHDDDMQPPFAEYPTGHSAFSMAAAQVLRRFTGSDRFSYFHTQNGPLRTDPTAFVAGVSLHWDTFTGAALDAGRSRLHGGVHFQEANEAGLELGRRAGEAVYRKAESLWHCAW